MLKPSFCACRSGTTFTCVQTLPCDLSAFFLIKTLGEITLPFDFWGDTNYRLPIFLCWFESEFVLGLKKFFLQLAALVCESDYIHYFALL